MLVHLVQIFDTLQESIIFSIGIFATENFFMINQMGETGLKLKQILFLQSESLVFNTFLLVLS